MAYEQLEIIGLYGTRIMVDVAFKIGPIAVTREEPPSQQWTLTHTPTGFRVPHSFRSSVAAAIAARELDEIVDWDGAVRTWASGQKPNVLGEIRRILRENGGTRPIGNYNIDPEELRRRVYPSEIETGKAK